MSDSNGAITNGTASKAKNVRGKALQPCSRDPETGFYRNGRCDTGPRDRGAHVVCAEMTAEFLAFTKRQGNDLSTPQPQVGFPGLESGDCWRLCAARWQEAVVAGCAPPVHLGATHEDALKTLRREDLEAHAAG